MRYIPFSLSMPVDTIRLTRAIQKAGEKEGWTTGVKTAQEFDGFNPTTPEENWTIFARCKRPTTQGPEGLSRPCLFLQFPLLRRGEKYKQLEVEVALFPEWTRKGLILKRSCEWLFLAGLLVTFLATVAAFANLLFPLLDIWSHIDILVSIVPLIVSILLTLMAIRLSPELPPVKSLSPENANELKLVESFFEEVSKQLAQDGE